MGRVPAPARDVAACVVSAPKDKPIPGFPGARWVWTHCTYCNGKHDHWWNCPGRHNHRQSHRGQVLPPIGEVRPVPFDGDWEALQTWGKPTDGHPQHCGVLAWVMADSRPWFGVYVGPVWWCPACGAVSQLVQGITYSPTLERRRGWHQRTPTDEERNPISFMKTL